MTLHVVNGDSAAGTLRHCGIEGDFLSWDDVLHMGPIRAGLDGPQMAALRARFISDCGWADFAESLQRFERRDAIVAAADDVLIWSSFELYDQLHLLQLLDRLDAQQRVEVVFYAGYLGEGFAQPEQALELQRQASTVTAVQYRQARTLWQALGADNPMPLQELLAQAMPELPFMAKSMWRLLQEYPWLDTGLSRSEMQILKVCTPHSRPGALFRAAQGLEEIRFMGDWSFWLWLQGLLEPPVEAMSLNGPPGDGEHPWVPIPAPGSEAFASFLRSDISLTPRGEQLLAGQLQVLPDQRNQHWIGRQIGGVTLGDGPDWRWCPKRQRIVERT